MFVESSIEEECPNVKAYIHAADGNQDLVSAFIYRKHRDEYMILAGWSL